jgi:hypothetical protein
MTLHQSGLVMHLFGANIYVNAFTSRCAALGWDVVGLALVLLSGVEQAKSADTESQNIERKTAHARQRT